MTAPRWAAALLRRLSRATGAEADVLIGDLEEARRARVARHGDVVATLLTTLETMDIIVNVDEASAYSTGSDVLD